MSSVASDSPLQYRFGLHKNSGHPQSVNAINGEAPVALMPGLCAKAAFSYEQSKDIWRVKETKEDFVLKTKRGKFWCPAYDVRLKEPHATVSAVIGNFSWLCSCHLVLIVNFQIVLIDNFSLPPLLQKS